MNRISANEYHTLRDMIKEISIPLWRNLIHLMNKCDADVALNFLARMFQLTVSKEIPTFNWVVWNTDTELEYSTLCEVMDLLDGYFCIKEETPTSDMRKLWYISLIIEGDN